MPVSQSKLARLTPNLGILWISVCSFRPCESIVANPIIYRLVPSPSRYEIRQYFLLYSGCGLCTNVKFSCRCLIDGLLTNQIALLFPVRGRTEFGKRFGIKGRRFLSSPPPPPSYSPPPYFSPIFWLTPGVLLRSPAFHSLVRSPRRPKKERNRLLRRLFKYQENCLCKCFWLGSENQSNR